MKRKFVVFLMLFVVAMVMVAPASAQTATPVFTFNVNDIIDPLAANMNAWLPIAAGLVAIGGGIMIAFILSDAVKNMIVNAIRSLRSGG